MEKTFTTLRGTIQTTRPMADLSNDERRDILTDLEVMSSKEVKAKWNITNLVISHLRWHCMGLLNGHTTTQTRVRELRRLGLNSPEVSLELGIDLAIVNKLW